VEAMLRRHPTAADHLPDTEEEFREAERLVEERRRLVQLARTMNDAAAREDDYYGTLVQVVRHEYPVAVERMRVEYEQHGQTYEEANWAKLSPAFREAHNKLRAIRGIPPIPPPAIDLYRPPAIRRADPKELEMLRREQQAAKAQFLGERRIMGGGREGFTMNGAEEKF
jgi:hypothetical protein